MAIPFNVSWEFEPGTGASTNSGGFAGLSWLKGATVGWGSGPSLAVVSGGSLAATTTYYIVITYNDTVGDSVYSAESSATTTSSNKTITVTSPAALLGATYYQVWWATTSGGPYTLAPSSQTVLGTNYSFTTASGSVQPPGNDYTQQASPQYSFSDLASTNGTNGTPTVTSASHTFTALDVGNTIIVSAGTNWTTTTGPFLITKVSAGGAVLDRACGSAASLSSGTWVEGGALDGSSATMLAFLSTSSAYAQNGNVCFFKYKSASPCLVASAISMVRGQGSSDFNEGRPFYMVGYDASGNRTPWSQPTNNPTIQSTSAGIMGGTAGAVVIRNIIFDENSHATNAVTTNFNLGLFFNCSAIGVTSAVAFGGTGQAHTNCTATVTSGTGFSGVYSCRNCQANITTGTGFDLVSNLEGCVAIGAGTSNGIGYGAGNGSSIASNCIAYNCQYGFLATVNNVQFMYMNCLAHTCSVGFRAANNTISMMTIIAGATYNCTTPISPFIPPWQILTNLGVGGALVSCSVDPCVAVGSNNFALNNTAGGGASLRAAGYQVGPNGTPFPDIGAVQTTDTGGGGSALVINPGTDGGFQ